jgi:hypothetical protein
MYSFLLFLCLFPIHVQAWNIFSSPPIDSVKKAEYSRPRRDETPPPCLSRKEKIALNRFACPSVNELYKQGMRWKTDSGWKGYQDSFATEISGFMGAQWKGVGIGRVICLYSPKDQNEFPIQLSTTQLVKRPVHAKWENEPKKDLLNCISNTSNSCDCQFSYYIEKQETDIDKIVEGIEKK